MSILQTTSSDRVCALNFLEEKNFLKQHKPHVMTPAMQ